MGWKSGKSGKMSTPDLCRFGIGSVASQSAPEGTTLRVVAASGLSDFLLPDFDESLALDDLPAAVCNGI